MLSSLPYLIVKLEKELYAISVQHVREIIRMPAYNRVPHMGPHDRGVIHLRGKILRLVDLRVLLQMVSLHEESNKMFEQRKADHIKWLGELEACVNEKRAFQLARDPHKCAFGKWYDQFKTDDRDLSAVLAQFEKPHAHIHAMADAVLRCGEQGDFASAKRMIEKARETDLHVLLDLFEQVKAAYSKSLKEIAVILMHPAHSKEIAICVDAVESVEKIDLETEQDLSAFGQEQKRHPCLKKVMRSLKNDQVILGIDPVHLFA